MRTILAASTVSVLFFLNCGPSDRTLKLQEAARTMIGTVPESVPGAQDTKEQIALGQKLYNDTILSADQTISCNSCHHIENNGPGVDSMRVSTGIRGQTGNRNAPTVWNAGFHVAQFWDGRAKNLEEQAGKPILNPIEMGMPGEADVIDRLRNSRDYPDLFRAAFPDDPNPLTYTNLTRAIAASERTLITSDRFDRFIKGDVNALTGRELKGFSLFLELGCISCHNGPLIGGNSFRRLGGVVAYDNVTDTGRFAITGVDADRFVFKVPSLRNIAVTGPYFHDGSRPDLENAIATMGRLQLGKNLNRLEIAYIADFLRTLTDPRLQRPEAR